MTDEEVALLRELERAIRQEWFGDFRDEDLRDPGDILRSIDEVRAARDGA